MLDSIDLKIIDLLTQDARRSLADIGAKVDLSPSTINERIRRLVATGVIKRFTVEVEPRTLELPVLAFVWIALRDDANEEEFHQHAQNHPLILECHHVTGPWSYLLKIRVKDTNEIEAFLQTLKAARFLGRSETMIAMSSPVSGVMVRKQLPQDADSLPKKNPTAV